MARLDEYGYAHPHRGHEWSIMIPITKVWRWFKDRDKKRPETEIVCDLCGTKPHGTKGDCPCGGEYIRKEIK